MYQRLSKRLSVSTTRGRFVAFSASALSVSLITGAQAQTFELDDVDSLPPIEVDTSAQASKKKKPTSEPQAPVTQEPSAGPDEPIVFSANRTPTDAAKVGSSVSVITEGDIDAESKTFLGEYLQQVPGVNTVVTGGPGSQTTFRIRGLNQNYIKVLVDGMDLSDPSLPQTATQLEHFLVGDMAQVEVLKGSQSTLYGGDAVAGVVSIDTKYARRPGVFQSGGAEYGTYNTWRGAYSAGYGTIDGSNIAFTVQGVDTDGFSAAAYGTEDDGYRNLTLSGRGELKISDEVTLFFAGRALDARLEYDTSSGFDAYNVADTVQQAGRVGANITLLGGRFVNTIAIQGMQIERDIETPPYNSWNDGDRVKGEYRGTFSFNKSLALVAGVDWERVGFESMFDERQSVEVTSPYAQLIMEPLDGLVLTAGARVDDHSIFGAYDTHRLTGAYLIPQTETKFHASYGTGFRAPSLYELYSFSGSTGFQPETSKSWDAGVEQGFMGNRYGVGATYFEIDIENLITYNDNTFSYEQIPGLTKTHGVELTAFAKLTQWTSVNLGYTYTDSEEPDGTRLVRLPRHNLALGITTQPIDKLTLTVNGLYVADSLDGIYEPYPVFAKKSVDDYFLLSAKAGYEVMPGTVAYVRGENLLDQNYTTAINYNNPGLTVFGGVQFSLPAE